MKTSTAEQIVGGLSRPSKMPGWSYNLPAKRCQIGAKLAQQPGSVCYGCYALKGRYQFANVQNALERRFQALSHPLWVAAMSTLIARRCKKVPYFRWHDSGDIQSVAHLRQIAEVAEATPDVRHWLPTREYAYVRRYLATYGGFPPNLCVRLSAPMVGERLARDKWDNPTSSVDALNKGGSFRCPAPNQGNECGDCRACWQPSVANVDYAKH